MRLLIPGIAALLFATFVVLHNCDQPLYFAILKALEEEPFRTPFLDTRFVTAQAECWQRGVDVYAANPCDPLGRTHDYSPLWLRLPFLAQPDSWTPVFGVGIDLLFLLALFAMPWKPGGTFGTVVALGAVVSWSTIFAAERGNTDLLIFAAIVPAALLLAGSAAARTAGAAIVLAAGLLKFYPLTLLGLLVREGWRRMWVLGAASAAVLAAFAMCFHVELARIGANMATGEFGGMFGARSLPVGLLKLWRALREAQGHHAPAAHADTLVSTALLVAMTGLCLAAAVARGCQPALRRMLDELEPRARALLVAGAVLCAGIFFGHQNIGYRAVFLLLAVPGLLGLVRLAPPGGRLQVGLRVTCILLVAACWGHMVDSWLPGWLMVQLAWWWVVGVLLAIAVAAIGSECADKLGQLRRLAGRPPRIAQPAPVTAR